MADERRPRTISTMPRLSPDDIANRVFATSFRGYAEPEVRSFLKRISEEITALRDREHELLAAVDDLEARLAAPRPLDEKELLDALGEETARLLRNAREAAEDIRQKSEERAARITEEAQADGQRLRHEAAEILAVRTREAEDAAAEVEHKAEAHAAELRAGAERYVEESRLRAQHEAEAIVEAARTQGREMVEEAKAVRERVLGDLGRRRGLLQAQLEELRNGRDHLLEAYRVVKRTFLEATEALAQAEARAAEGKPLPSVDRGDVDAVIASEAAEGLATDETPGAAAEAVKAAPEDDATVALAAVDVAAPLEAAEPHGDGTPEAAAPEIEPAGDGEEGDDSPRAMADVDSLFARIRAGAEARVAGADAGEAPDAPVASRETGETTASAPASAAGGEAEAPAAEAEAETEGERAAEAPGAPAGANDEAHAHWREQESATVAPLVAPLVKQSKRTAQDEQNALLDALRRHKGRPTSEQILPADPDVVATWSAVLRSGLDTAYGAGRTAAGGDAVGAPPDLCEEAVRHVVMPLRERLANAIDDTNDGLSTSLVIERIGARYREWKLQSLEAVVEDVLAVAWSRGVFDAVGDGTMLQWLPASEGRCPDCDDNALEPTAKGEAFPTGQLHPPAHPGCRCLLIPVESQS